MLIKNRVNILSMKIIPKKSEYIKVQSAFGGFALYKSEVFLKNDYKNNVFSR